MTTYRMRADGVLATGPEGDLLAGWAIEKAAHGKATLEITGDREALLGRGVSAGVAAGLLAAGLRGYQVDLVRRVLREGRMLRGYVSAPAGSGKTHLCGGLVVAWTAGRAEPSASWAYLVTNQELAKQTERVLSEWIPAAWSRLGTGAPPEVRCFSYGEVWVGSGSEGSPGSRHEEFMQCTAGLLVDEIHAAVATTRSTVILLSRAVVRIGLSATPVSRGDGLGRMVVGLLGPELGRVNMDEVTRAGGIAPGLVWAPEDVR